MSTLSKKKAQNVLRQLNKMIESLEKSMSVLEHVGNTARKHEAHGIAVKSVAAIKTLNDVLDELIAGQRRCLEIIGAVEIPIINKNKPNHLRLVVNNTRKENRQ